MLENDETLNQILTNLKGHKISLSSASNKNKNKSKNKTIQCEAAVKLTTIGTAYDLVSSGAEIYIAKEGNEENPKMNAYSRCSKTVLPLEERITQLHLCHLHCRMNKTNNKGVKVFESLIPKDSTDKKSWLATIDDEYFSNMGKRGAKKKKYNNTFTFKTSNNPILLILIHKNRKYYDYLIDAASYILRNNKAIYEPIQTSFKQIDFSDEDSYEEVISKEGLLKDDESEEDDETSVKDDSEEDDETSVKDDPEEDDETSVKDDSEEDDETSVKDDSEEDDETSVKDDPEEDDETSVKDDPEEDDETSVKDDLEEDDETSVKDDPEEEDSEESDSDSEGVPCNEIRTNKNKLLWFNEKTGDVYEPEGDDGGLEIGVLTEISKEFHNIQYNKKFYTVLAEIIDKNKDNKKIFCCVLTNSLFDSDLNFIGTRELIKDKNGSKEYRFNYI
jgi:hypothetical protein